jgi:hypothetical protein
MSASMKYPPTRYTGVVTPMVMFTAPSSAGQAPEIQRMLFSRSPATARVTVVLPTLDARQRVHVGAAHAANPSFTAARPTALPSEGGTDATLTR